MELIKADAVQVANALISRATEIIVKDAVSYTEAGSLCDRIRKLQADREDSYKNNPTVQAARELQAQNSDWKSRLDAALKTAKGQMISFDAQQEAERKAKEALAQAEAQKAIDAQAVEEASQLEAIGDRAAAEAVLQAVPVAPAIVLPKSTPKVNGHKVRTVWKFRVTDESKVPNEFKVLDMVKIGGVVRAMKSQTQIPGIEPYEEKC